MRSKKKVQEDYTDKLASLKAKMEESERQEAINKVASIDNTFIEVLESCDFVGVKLKDERVTDLAPGTTVVIREYMAFLNGDLIKGSIVNTPCEPVYIEQYLDHHPNNKMIVKNGHTITIVNNN